MEDEKLRVIPIHRALIRPDLLMGCDRKLFIGLAAISAIFIISLGLGSGHLSIFLTGIAIFFIGRRSLATLAKKEPYALDIFKASIKYHRLYLAKSGGRFHDKNKRFVL